jgi:3-oxoacyl-[acyl-carrier protein] reductase
MVAQTVEELGRLDILVNNAGTTYFVPNANLDGLTEDMWNHILAVNLKGTFFCSRAAAPFMRQAGQGEIVNVASVAGIRGGGSSIAYSVSKAGVISLTTNLARALAPEIRVNCVAPGFIDTRWLRRGMGERYESARDRAAERNPLGRVSTPEDVAQVIVGLIAEADHVTGQTLVVDGGAGLA